MSRVIVPTESFPAVDVRPSRTLADERPIATTGVDLAQQQELAALRREVAQLRTLRQRDLATARGLGEALQALRRGAMALRAENEDLRRQLSSRPTRKR